MFSQFVPISADVGPSSKRCLCRSPCCFLLISSAERSQSVCSVQLSDLLYLLPPLPWHPRFGTEERAVLETGRLHLKTSHCRCPWLGVLLCTVLKLNLKSVRPFTKGTDVTIARKHAVAVTCARPSHASADDSERFLSGS